MSTKYENTLSLSLSHTHTHTYFDILHFFSLIAAFSGYMSPEYVIDGLYSTKSDVFSFGVLVLEIVSGKRNRGFYHPDHDLNLVGHVSSNLNFVYFFKLASSWILKPVGIVPGMEIME